MNNLTSFYESLSLSYKKTPSLDYFLNNYPEDEPVLEERSINVSTVHKAKGLEFPVVLLQISQAISVRQTKGCCMLR